MAPSLLSALPRPLISSPPLPSSPLAPLPTGMDDGGSGNRRISDDRVPSLPGLDDGGDGNQGSGGIGRCSGRIRRRVHRIGIGRSWISGSGGLRVDTNGELYVLDSEEEDAGWDANYVPDSEPQVVDATGYYVPDSEDVGNDFFVPETQYPRVEVGDAASGKEVKAATAEVKSSSFVPETQDLGVDVVDGALGMEVKAAAVEVEGSSFVPETQLQDPKEVNVTAGVEDGPAVMEVDDVIMNVMDILAADFYRTICLRREGEYYPSDVVLSMLEVLLPAYFECSQK